MKKFFVLAGQFLLFLAFDVAGSIFYHPFNVLTPLAGTPTEPRTFVWDGLLLMLIAYVLVLLVALVRKRIAGSLPWTTLALLLAAAVGYGLKLGFVTQNW